ncbi:MAG TPA: phenylalanine--tRNA ligase subunit beta [Myxococcota bacterium]|jgi:phenylalanyl-tRNA synthetase beta chain
MRLSLDWLAELVDLPADAELIEGLSVGGFEDVSVTATGPDFSALRVGHVLERAAHPNADRLSVCRVDVGAGDPLEIVCGAPNVAAGQKVAVALVGTRLPDGRTLERAKLRGVVSNGMILSARELGLSDEHEGILVLDPAAPVGAPLSQALRAAGRVLELGITPNRGDAASLLGVAREVRAVFGGALRLPESAPPERGAPARGAIAVSIEAPDGCHHYVARVVRGVRNLASPDWLQRKLEASGLRSRGVVVDVTNLVLLELGQPLHAFDLRELRGGQVRVRRARSGEKLATLDGETRELDPRDLVIADEGRAIALAGVMGGRETEVNASTVDVLIESAHFAAVGVRRSARRHGIRSEASYRFERGVDPEGVRRAADRAARLLAELAAGEVAEGTVEARGEPAPPAPEILLELARANHLLGTRFTAAQATALLARVEVTAREAEPGSLRCRPPSHRGDLRIPEDLAEELARIHGVDKIATTLPVGTLAPVSLPPLWALADRARDALVAAGLFECLCFPFVPEGDGDRLGLAPEDPRRRTLRVVNPVKEEEGRLRASLLPSLLRLARQNLDRQVDPIRIFEVSRVFHPQEEPEPPAEPLWLAGLLTAPRQKRLWQTSTPPPVFFELKGIAERLLIQLGCMASLREGAVQPYLHPGAAAAILADEQVIGSIGELHPDVAARFEIDVPCALLELDLERALRAPRRAVRFREVSRFPQVRRDIAVYVAREQRAEELLAAIAKTAGPDLHSVELFDRYEGAGVPEGRLSLAFRLVFQRLDRTLTDAEVASAVERVVRMLSHRFGGNLR